jgi:hypothetical protein
MIVGGFSVDFYGGIDCRCVIIELSLGIVCSLTEQAGGNGVPDEQAGRNRIFIHETQNVLSSIGHSSGMRHLCPMSRSHM